MAAEATIMRDPELGGSISVSKPGLQRLGALTLWDIGKGTKTHSRGRRTGDKVGHDERLGSRVEEATEPILT